MCVSSLQHDGSRFSRVRVSEVHVDQVKNVARYSKGRFELPLLDRKGYVSNIVSIHQGCPLDHVLEAENIPVVVEPGKKQSG